MQIILNGQPTEVSDHTTIGELVIRLELGGKRFAVEVNGEIVPRSLHADRVIDTGDTVEIVHAIGGG